MTPNYTTHSFLSNGNKLIAKLYLPTPLPSSPPPVIVVTGAWTTVKEQMPHVYAAELAQRGFAAFTFDFSGWGQSEGENRFLEDPIAKTEDIKAAVHFLTRCPDVDTSQIAGLGLCASSGYMVKAFTETPALKTIALVAPWLHNPAIAKEVYGGPDAYSALIATSDKASQKFQETGQITTITAASTTDQTALMYQAPYYTEPDRGLIAAYDNQFNLASWRPWLTFDAITLADQLSKPLFFVHSKAAVIPHGIKQFAEAATPWATGLWLDNITQFEFYDQTEPVRLASDAIARHFSDTLSPQ
ncbi:alpha/beta hydrolase [Rubritalea tangerina]|uniref:Alpha/beta hydrolase n=1 Tax=Rubritalea tangerina TaxID=430798 RepID=A0ABW4ZD65_9BACT